MQPVPLSLVAYINSFQVLGTRRFGRGRTVEMGMLYDANGVARSICPFLSLFGLNVTPSSPSRAACQLMTFLGHGDLRPRDTL